MNSCVLTVPGHVFVDVFVWVMTVDIDFMSTIVPRKYVSG